MITLLGQAKSYAIDTSTVEAEVTCACYTRRRKTPGTRQTFRTQGRETFLGLVQEYFNKETYPSDYAAYPSRNAIAAQRLKQVTGVEANMFKSSCSG